VLHAGYKWEAKLRNEEDQQKIPQEDATTKTHPVGKENSGGSVLQFYYQVRSTP